VLGRVARDATVEGRITVHERVRTDAGGEEHRRERRHGHNGACAGCEPRDGCTMVTSEQHGASACDRTGGSRAAQAESAHDAPRLR
jgi:hypothetical protein